MSKIIVNDEAQDVALPVSVLELLKANNVQSPDMVAVQINGEIVPADTFATRQVAEGDTVDFLFFMGGGEA